MPERDHDFAHPGMSSSSSMAEPPSQRMTNEDFRKLMMTPRAGSGSTASASSATSSSSHSATASSQAAGDVTPRPSDAKSGKSGHNAESRKKKKSYYANLKKQEDDKLAELAAKYRDRAKERRDGPTLTDPRAGGAASEESGAAVVGAPGASGAYRAVAPDIKSTFDAAERRKKMIQESKFLGGDMEHTHLVKGLDFALLQKVRSEITNREKEGENAEDEEEEEEAPSKEVKAKQKPSAEKEDKAKETDPIAELRSQCRTNLAKNVVSTAFKRDIPKCNELFFPGRMAYIIDLEEEFGAESSDIPTTTIRSKADVEMMGHQHSSMSTPNALSTNDIVINKLTQILSYLRAGSRNKKKKKEKHLALARGDDHRENISSSAKPNISIYDDVGEYVPDLRRDGKDRQHDQRDRHHRDNRDRKDRRDRDRYEDKHKERDRDGFEQKRSYFDEGEDQHEDHKGGLSNQDKDFIRRLTEKEREKSKREQQKQLDSSGKPGLSLASAAPEGYAECYPGLAEMNDAIDDSDDEADYTKMDLGNKKGPVGRWDFDTPEEYADYMSRKEALPKAAFQYGVKMTEGRKTRGKVGAKSEKAKLDREWTKISALIDKRKTPGGGGEAKKPKLE